MFPVRARPPPRPEPASDDGLDSPIDEDSTAGRAAASELKSTALPRAVDDADDEVDDDADASHRELPEELKPEKMGMVVKFEQANVDDEGEMARFREAEEARAQARLVEGSNGKRMIPLIALHPDQSRVPGQNYACISIVRPEHYQTLHHGQRKYHGMLIKVRGVFETREEADAWIKENIMALDPHFDVHLVKCHEWSGLEDDDVRDREYVDDQIKDIMTSYFQEEHDKMLGMRKRIEIARRQEKRTKEAGNFFREAVAEPDPRRRLPDVPANAVPMSLDQVRQSLLNGPRLLASAREAAEGACAGSGSGGGWSVSEAPAQGGDDETIVFSLKQSNGSDDQ